jgi:DNA invertase Pin-like site-specific DNA recombinase
VKPALRPAAYIRLSRQNVLAATGVRELSLTDAAVSRGWPAPDVFIDDGHTAPDGGPALSRLAAAIEAGRYDALLLAGPTAVMSSSTAQFTLLLRRCTRNGVQVIFVPPSGR